MKYPSIYPTLAFLPIYAQFCSAAFPVFFAGNQLAERYRPSTNPEEKFASTNPFASKFQAWKDDLLVVFPRFVNSSPITAARTTNKGVWKPYWMAMAEWDNTQDALCEQIINATDITTTPNDLAWILDKGTLCPMCPPKVVAVELGKNIVNRVVDLSFFQDCTSNFDHFGVGQSRTGHTYIYVGDSGNNRLAVWDVMRATGWKVFLPSILRWGVCEDDTLYVALLHNPDGSNVLFLSYLSSPFVFTARTEFLRTGSATGRVVFKGVKPRQVFFLGTDGGQHLYFRYEGEKEVYAWNSNKEFREENFLRVYGGTQERLATCVAPDFTNKRMLILESDYINFLNGTAENVKHLISPLFFAPGW